MAHARYPASWWQYNGWINNPTTGSPEEANSGLGFNRSDFELPLWEYGTLRYPNAKGGVLYNGEKGLVGNVCNASNGWTDCATTDKNRKPIYAFPGASPFYTVKGPDTFRTWFNDDETVRTLYVDLTLVPWGRSHKYENRAFFPIDNKGWKDWQLDENGQTRNFGFCMEIHNHFIYQGGETFYVSGDDDIWVYVDGRLVIDLGGIHMPQNALIQLDDIAGLEVGGSYEFDFFSCERHSADSLLTIETTIALTCNYYDWCDVCEGDGQSCCTADKLAICDDHNPCTVDKCAVAVPPFVDCSNKPVSCKPEGNSTDSYYCDPVYGCMITPPVCNDNDACTIDSYDCSHPCNDTNNVNKCVHKAVNCAAVAPSPCYTPVGCDKVDGCLYKPKVCPQPENWCFVAICDDRVGCLEIPRTCLTDDPDCYIAECNSTTESCSQPRQRPDFEDLTSEKKHMTCQLAYFGFPGTPCEFCAADGTVLRRILLYIMGVLVSGGLLLAVIKLRKL